jgi:hypothetical protein
MKESIAAHISNSPFTHTFIKQHLDISIKQKYSQMYTNES